MKTIIPISDLQRQAAAVLDGLKGSSEPVVITQRGRASAVLISATRYAEIEEDLAALDEIELVRMAEEAEAAIREGDTLSQDEVKKRLGYPG